MSPQKHFFAKIPSIALFILFAMSPPLGLILFILRSIDKKLEKEEKAAQRTQQYYSWDIHSTDARTEEQKDASTQDGEAIYGHDRPTMEQKKAKERHKTITILCTVFGALFLLAGLTDLGDAIYFVTHFWDWSDLISCVTQIVGGGGALWMGLQMKKSRKMERLLDKIVGDRDNIALDELFSAAGVDVTKGRTIVEKAIEHGYFGANAYIDYRTNTLVVRGAAPQPTQPDPAPEQHTAKDPYVDLLNQLRAVNNAIPDPVMTEKISRLEHLSTRIFTAAAEDAGKKAQLQRFTDYYLPTALSLLNKYVSLSAQGVQGQNITEAKQNIEHSMDLLITAFENQLDKLFQSDALDVSADIAALQGMLNLDGLTNDGFQ